MFFKEPNRIYTRGDLRNAMFSVFLGIAFCTSAVALFASVGDPVTAKGVADHIELVLVFVFIPPVIGAFIYWLVRRGEVGKVDG